MATLTKKQRSHTPPAEFGLAEKHAYPMPDVDHVHAAEMDGGIAHDRGQLSDEDYRHILAVAHALAKRYGRAR